MVLVNLGCHNKYHRLDGIKTMQILISFLAVLEARNFDIKVYKGSASGRALPGWQVAAFSLCPHITFSLVGAHKAREISPSSYKAPSPID